MIGLVHGALADASSWNKVVPILQDDGYMGALIGTTRPDGVALQDDASSHAGGP